MTYTTLNLEQFIGLVKDIKFTPAQKKIVDRLIKGDKLWIINKHRADGGEYTWKTSHSISPEYAGSVYKAFWNIQWVIKKQKGIEVDFSIFFYNN
jgi:hypothetical protein